MDSLGLAGYNNFWHEFLTFFLVSHFTSFDYEVGDV